MVRSYEKGTGDRSVRIEKEYRLNEAGVKQYIQDRINRLNECDSSTLEIHHFNCFEAQGAVMAFHAVGLIEIFDLNNYFEQISLSLGKYTRNLVNN